VFQAFIGEVGVLVLLSLMGSLDSVFARASELDSQQFSPSFRPQQDVRAIWDVSNVHWEPVVTVLVVSKIEPDNPVVGGTQSFSQSGGCLCSNDVLIDSAAFPDECEGFWFDNDSRILLIEVGDAADEVLL
jgi:hypothetical protein